MNTAAETCDVAIIGGGPAGSAAGARLAAAGLSVVIFEREKFPRFCIGESLLPHGNDLLRELGVWSKMEKAGFLKKYGAEFCTADNSRHHRLWFADNLGKDHEYTFQVDRATFDQLLLDHARENGCAVHEETRVTSLNENPDRTYTLDYATPAGPHRIQSRWIIDASGRQAFAGSRLGLNRSGTQKIRRVALYAHYTGAGRHPGLAEGHITIVRFAEGWFWMIPLAHDCMSVGLVLPMERVSGRQTAELEEIFARALENAPAVAQRLANATRITPLHRTGDYSWKFSSFATQRVVLTGDAAGFVDPIFSSGVMLALKSGSTAAGIILRAHRANRALTWWERRAYTKSVSSWMKHYSRLIRSFYDISGFEVFMSPQPFFQIPASVARLVGGQAAPGWMDRIRLQLFQLICRLQRQLPIVPSIPSLR
jgi:flavin-dependent dehydrogenase